ncbi:MAG TPA: cupin domain-containing protein [Clostridia bacterium]|nr:cupin domain-containing protein [Clostridia bacterium]
MNLIKLYEMAEKEMVPGYHAKFVHSENVTLAYWSIEEGNALPKHAHPHEQVVNLLEGSFEITVDEEVLILKPGSVVVIPSNVMHSGKALTSCRIIDVFYPIRTDYIQK